MACPVCYNAAAADDTVRTSLNLGILLLLGVTAGVLAGFLRFIISIARRSSRQGDAVGRSEMPVRLPSAPDESLEPGLTAEGA